MITPLPGAGITKPGSATLPFFGQSPAILDQHTGEKLEGNSSRCLFVLNVYR